MAENRITRGEARGIANRLRALLIRSPQSVVKVIRKTLTPDDLAALETFAGLVKEKARNV